MSNDLLNKKSAEVNEDEDKIAQIAEDVESDISEGKNKVPSQYVKVKFDSNGRLGYPKVLHFRDYSMDEALALDTYEEKDQFKALVYNFNNMNYEGFDCSELHIKDLMTVVYSIHARFIGSTIEKSFYINEELPEGKEEGQKDHLNNIGTYDVPLSSLKMKSIDEDPKGNKLQNLFKEPFRIFDAAYKQSILFRMPRVGDMIKA